MQGCAKINLRKTYGVQNSFHTAPKTCTLFSIFIYLGIYWLSSLTRKIQYIFPLLTASAQTEQCHLSPLVQNRLRSVTHRNLPWKCLRVCTFGSGAAAWILSFQRFPSLQVCGHFTSIFLPSAPSTLSFKSAFTVWCQNWHDRSFPLALVDICSHFI